MSHAHKGLRLIATLVMVAGVFTTAYAQSAAKMPAATPPPAAPQQEFLSYWTTEGGWDTQIQLRNNGTTGDLTVTPVLRDPGGQETSLEPVTVKVQDVQIFDVMSAVSAQAPQLMGSYGSVVLRYSASTPGVLFAMAMVKGVGHPFAFHIDPSGQLPTYTAGSREGIWWLPAETTNDWLILTNQDTQPMQLDLSIYDASGKEFREPVTLSAGATARYSVRQIVSAAGLSGTYGGIKISSAKQAGSLDTLHILFDQTSGFSALLKMFDNDPNAKTSERDFAGTGQWTLRAPMLALSNPDPALALPAGATLQPRLLIRNTSQKPVTAALSFHWRSATANGKSAGPVLQLAPYQTQLVDVAALQAANAIPKDASWASVALVTNGLPGSVMAVAASYDSGLKYGAQTPFSDQLAYHWVGSLWEYDAYHDSIIAVGNGGTKPTQAAFTISYNGGAKTYELDQSLQPDDQMWIDVGQLISGHIPDKNGNVLPDDLSAGTYEIRQPGHGGIGSLYEGKVVYDKTYGHATYGCASCCAYKGAFTFVYNPLGIPDDGTAPQEVKAYDTCSGMYLYPTDDFYDSWNTTNPSIATVDANGVHTGVAIGSTTTHAQAQEQLWYRWNDCPIQTVGPIGNDNTTPTISGSGNLVWWFNGYGSSAYPTSITLTSSGGNGTQWNVTSGATKITLSPTTGGVTTVTSSGNAFSASQNDVTVTATVTVGEQQLTSAPFYITSRKPYWLVSNGAAQTDCDPTYGYVTQIPYVIQDQFLVNLPSSVGINESWTTGVVNDYPGSTWRRGNPGGTETSGATFADQIQGEAPGYVPTAACSGSNTAVQHWGQEWWVGTETSGSGVPVQTNTLQKNLINAAHTSITTPVQ